MQCDTVQSQKKNATLPCWTTWVAFVGIILSQRKTNTR